MRVWRPGWPQSRQLASRQLPAVLADLRWPSHLDLDQAAQVVLDVAKRFLDEDFDKRRAALTSLPQQTGLSPPMVAWALDTCFGAWNPSDVQRLLDHDVRGGQPWTVIALPVIFQILSGNVLAVAIDAILLGVLARSAQILKPSTNVSVLCRLIVETVVEHTPELADTFVIVDYRGQDNVNEESLLFSHAQGVVVYGSDETVQAVSQKLSAGSRLIAHGHRVSCAVVSSEKADTPSVAEALSRDLVAYDQLGCLSPQAVFVIGAERATVLAEMMHERYLPRLAAQLPRGEVPLEARAAISQLRQWACMTGKVWEGTSWTLTLGRASGFPRTPLYRTLPFCEVESLDELAVHVEPVRRFVECVGVAASETELPELQRRLMYLGASWICPVGQMQQPPVWRPADGRDRLRELVRWSACSLS